MPRMSAAKFLTFLALAAIGLLVEVWLWDLFQRELQFYRTAQPTTVELKKVNITLIPPDGPTTWTGAIDLTIVKRGTVSTVSNTYSKSKASLEAHSQHLTSLENNNIKLYLSSTSPHTFSETQPAFPWPTLCFMVIAFLTLIAPILAFGAHLQARRR